MKAYLKLFKHSITPIIITNIKINTTLYHFNQNQKKKNNNMPTKVI